LIRITKNPKTPIVRTVIWIKGITDAFGFDDVWVHRHEKVGVHSIVFHSFVVHEVGDVESRQVDEERDVRDASDENQV